EETRARGWRHGGKLMRRGPGHAVRSGPRRSAVEWSVSGSGLHDAVGRKPLLSRLELEFHRLTFCESLESVHLNRGKMDEHILALLLFNETVTLGVIEPLHLSLRHHSPPAYSCGATFPRVDAAASVSSATIS